MSNIKDFSPNEVVDDKSPQLGGNLDLNGFDINFVDGGIPLSKIDGIPMWSRQTANFNAVSNSKYKVNPGLIVTLPALPLNNDQVWFSPLGDIKTTNVTIERNGNNIMGLVENMTWNANVSFSLVYDLTNTDWRFA